jgi:hypothetical protein
MTTRKATLFNGSLVACATHKRKRTFKPRSTKPTNKCPVCWACWLADRLETSVYKDDLNDIFTLSNAFTTVVKPSGIVFEETSKDD